MGVLPEVEWCAMKAAAFAILLTLGSPSSSVPQACCAVYVAPPTEVRISPESAEKLLIHKVDPVVKCAPMAARVVGTVVIAIRIGKKGEVLHPVIVSGPRMLRQAALEAVRQYKYQPYMLNNVTIFADTTVNVRFDLSNSC